MMLRDGDLQAGSDGTARWHSQRLAELVRAEAKANGGAVTFDRFMELALYAPGLGYYVAGASKFGRGGDFVTAPTLSPLFGHCLARQCQEVLKALGGGDILELGAGTGDLAADILDGFKAKGRQPGSYLILEPSPELRERQKNLLEQRHPDLLDSIQWLNGLPQQVRGVVIANEVMDAQPVHRFQVGAHGEVMELLVRPRAEGWEEFPDSPRSPGLELAVKALQAQGLALAPGYTSEVNLRLGPWLAALAGSLASGLLLLIDYGYDQNDYYRPERVMGTLMCHYRHQAHSNPYINLGLQDITAHVDFSSAARAASQAGLELAGFCTQAHFLMALGLPEMLEERLKREPNLNLLMGAKQLIVPTAMGERFRVLGLTKELSGKWTGFSLRDLRARL